MLVSRVNNDNTTAFCWQHSTHRFITEKLVRSYNEYLPAKTQLNYDILKYSCVEPDFSRRNITKYIHGHFADIDNLSNDPPDGYALAIRYTKKAIEAHLNKNYGKRDDYLGYALHFIQDILNPKHVVFEAVPKGHPERNEHKHFEQIAETIQEDALRNTTLEKNIMSIPFFKTTLPEAMLKTKELHYKIKNKDYNNLAEIAAEALKTTYKTTNEYLHKFTMELQKRTTDSEPLQKELRLFEDELLIAA